MRLTVPELSLVALVGISGSGKSTFARTHFAEPEVLSSDQCRALVSNDENDQSATRDAFDLLYTIADVRLRRGLLTVVDATNVQRSARKQVVATARRHHVLPVAIVLDMPLSLCKERNATRPDRDFPERVLKRQHDDLRRSVRKLKGEGFRYVHVVSSPEELAEVEIVRTRSWTDRSDERGPFDLIGDVHGCFEELTTLLGRLGYEVGLDGDDGLHHASHPEGRRVVLLGDLVDRGPATPDVLKLAMGMHADGDAIVVPGNHDDKLKRALMGRDVTVSHGLQESLNQLADETADFRARVVDWIDGLVSHFVLDGGDLVVAHAGMRADLAGRASRKVRDFALYGETTGETDEYGLPVRYDWAAEYRGSAAVVYGHTPVPRAEWLNNTICLDTGCVFGGELTALRWPERELVSIPAVREHYAPVKPLDAAHGDGGGDGRSLQQEHEDLLDIREITGKRQVETAHMGRVTVREEEAASALEVVSRFTVDPRWMIYLPPTMAPAGTTREGDDLEHPDEAWRLYRRAGVTDLVCEEKHMGSRAIITVARDTGVARERFGDPDGRTGVITTRTGRPFFAPDHELVMLDRIRDAVGAAGLWDALETDWLVLDAEVLPWNAKARELIREHFAVVGAAGRRGIGATLEVLRSVAERTGEATDLVERFTARADAVDRYVEAYGPYCWPVEGLGGIRVAPFHLLASEGAVHHERDHRWHLELLGRIIDADTTGTLQATNARFVDLDDTASIDAATTWWQELTAGGGEGMVVKPTAFTVRGAEGLVQPAVKVRGREYLRLIYGPEYTLDLDRLRDRNLGRKRNLALREYALGIEALQRFVDRRPLREVHEAVVGVLALESDPVDPRL